MTRKIVIGKYIKLQELTYCFYEEDGSEFVRLKAGDKYFFDKKFYYKIEEVEINGQKMLQARNWCKQRNTVLIQPLIPGKFYLATSAQGAISSLYTIYKEYEEDNLSQLLKQYKFVPGCVMSVKELADADIAIKHTVVPNCSNYLGQKNTYKYYVLSDSTEKDDISVTPESCIFCRLAKKKKNLDFDCDMMRTVYRQYLNGTYAVLLRTTETKKQIARIWVTPECDRDNLAVILERELKK